MNKIFTVDISDGEIVSVVVYHNKIIVATRMNVWELEETDKGFYEAKLKLSVKNKTKGKEKLT